MYTEFDIYKKDSIIANLSVERYLLYVYDLKDKLMIESDNLNPFLIYYSEDTSSKYDFYYQLKNKIYIENNTI